jgi:hypothetical protein
MNVTGNMDHTQQLTNMTNGSHTVSVNCTDPSGNSAEANITWNVDALGPGLTVDSPLNITYGGGHVWANVTGDEAMNSCTYSLDGATGVSMSNDSAIHFYKEISVGEWSHNITFTCDDMYGNSNTTDAVYFTMDLTAPEINLTSPATSVMMNGTIINFTIYDISNVSAFIWNNGGANTTVSFTGLNATEYASIDTTGWTEGNYTITVWANDTVGNMQDKFNAFGSNDTTIIVIIDDTAPGVIINQPVYDSWYSTTIPVTGIANDTNGISLVQYRWQNVTDGTNGSWENATLSGSDYLATINSTALIEGEDNYTIQIRAYDLAGNVNDTEIVTNISVDYTAPDVNITLPLAGTNLGGNSIRLIEANVSDTLSGFAVNATCKVYINTGYVGELQYNGTTGICSGNVILPNYGGAFSLIVKIKDKANNEGSDSRPVSITREENGGGGGGGDGGGSGNLTQPDKLDLEFTVTPDHAEVISDETISFYVDIKNIGKGIINNIAITTYDLNDGEYYTDPDGITLFPNQTGTLKLIVSPASLGTGLYKISFSVGNSVYSEGGSFTLNVTSAADVLAKAQADSTCNDADNYLIGLKADGINTTAVEGSLAKARLLITQGEYSNATKVCEAILALTPEEIGGGITPGGLTGLFIGVGKFAATNLFWIVVASGIVIGTYLMRRRIAGGLVAVSKTKIQVPKVNMPKVNMPKIALPKAPKKEIKQTEPSAPAAKVTAPAVKNGKEKMDAKQDLSKWDIEWK